MSRDLLFGTVTHVGENLSIIIAGKDQYKFSTSQFPKATLGMQVTFNVDDNVYSRDKYATHISALEVTNHVIRDLLERISKLEARMFEGNKFITEDRDYGTSETTSQLSLPLLQEQQD